MRTTPSWMNRDIGLLFAGRALRSLSQSYLTILVPIYAAKLGYNALDIGYLFTASAVSSVILATAVGFLSDRWGRRNLLVIISAMTALAGVVFALSTGFGALMMAVALGTVGRSGPTGAGGALGPFYPAEQALVAEHAPAQMRTAVFGALAFVGVMAGAIGSLLAALPALISSLLGVSILHGYRLLFWFTAGVGAAMVIMAIPIRESGGGADPPSPRPSGIDAPVLRTGTRLLGLSRSSWVVVSRFAWINGTNGLAVGMLGPFVVYWFYRRFAVTATELAHLFFFINLAAGIPNLAVGKISKRLGAVWTVVTARLISAGCLFLCVLMPNYSAAAIFYAARAVVGAMGIPVRQSYLMGLIDPSQRATAAGLTNLPLQATSLVSPYLAGLLMQDFWIGLPIELAAILQAMVGWMFYFFFHGLKPPEERLERNTAAQTR